MGASDSKLVFKQGIFKLAEQKDIPADDPYWAGVCDTKMPLRQTELANALCQFWELPESQEDVFSLFSAADIRRIRDEAFGNLETLILAVTSRLCALTRLPAFPHPEEAPERDVLNCIRILNRLLPFIYEADHLEEWEERYFWGARRKRVRRANTSEAGVLFDGNGTREDIHPPEEPVFEDVKPLAEELIDTLIDLLFFSDFTIPKTQGNKRVVYTIWQSGVGCNNPVATSQEMESRRSEVLRLLLTMTSQSMYTSTSQLLSTIN